MKRIQNTFVWQEKLVLSNTSWGQHKLAKIFDKPLNHWSSAVLPVSIAGLLLHSTMLSVLCIAYSTCFASLLMLFYVSAGAMANLFFVPKLATIASLHKYNEVGCMIPCLHEE